MKASGLCAAALLMILLTTGAAQADLIGVQLTPPILVTFDVDVNYDADGGGAGLGLFTAHGMFDPWGMWTSLQDYSLDGVTSSGSYLGCFLLTAVIDTTTLEPVSGSLSVSSDQGWDGYLDADMDWSGGALDSWEMGERAYSTDLAMFGFGGAGLFDFRFRNATGDMSNSGGVSVIVAGMFDGTGPFSLPVGWDTFQFDFQNSGAGKADIPEPVTMSLLALGGLGLLRRRRTSRSL